MVSKTINPNDIVGITNAPKGCYIKGSKQVGKKRKAIYFESWEGDEAVFTEDIGDAMYYATETSRILERDLSVLKTRYPQFKLKRHQTE